MGRNVRYGITALNNNVTAVTTAPSLGTHGTEYPKRHDCFECALIVTGEGVAVGDSLTIRPWWYDDVAGDWSRGSTTVVTNDGVIVAYCVGERIAWEVTAATVSSGHFELGQQFMNKSA